MRTQREEVSGSQVERPQEKQNLSTPWSWTSSFQNHAKYISVIYVTQSGILVLCYGSLSQLIHLFMMEMEDCHSASLPVSFQKLSPCTVETRKLKIFSSSLNHKLVSLIRCAQGRLEGGSEAGPSSVCCGCCWDKHSHEVLCPVPAWKRLWSSFCGDLDSWLIARWQVRQCILKLDSSWMGSSDSPTPMVAEVEATLTMFWESFLESWSRCTSSSLSYCIISI